MIFISNAVINMQETPGIIADVWANVPVNAYTPVGVLFIATDTLILYRNDGIAWQPVGSGGGAADIDTVLGVGNTAINKMQIFQDAPGDHNLQLDKNGLWVNDYTTGEKARVEKNIIYVSDAPGDFFAGIFASPGGGCYVVARTDKYGLFMDAAGQQIYYYEYTSGNRLNLIFPSGLTSNWDINFPQDSGTVQLQSIYGGSIDLTSSNYTLLQPNQYLDVIAVGTGNIVCDNMSTWPDGSTVNICVSSSGFNFTYVGTFKGNTNINKEGLYILQVVSGIVYCSDPA